MPDVQVSFLLPSYLRLAEGEYELGEGQGTIEVVPPQLFEGQAPRTQVRARFSHPDTEDQNAILSVKVREADHLLWRANRLLRRYRAVTRRAEMIEVTRAQASPFQFLALAGPANSEWVKPLKYEGAESSPLDLTNEQITDLVRAGLAGGREPDVAELFLLDAERALAQGRFRETVLFCWSTIDSVFNRKYALLANAALAGEWAEGRDFFTGIDYGLRHKMSAGMHLFAGRSLFREPGGLWERLTASYRKRNAIIHLGDNANEDEARQSIAVARQVVEIMDAVPAPQAGGQAAPEGPGAHAPPPRPGPAEPPAPAAEKAQRKAPKRRGK